MSGVHTMSLREILSKIEDELKESEEIKDELYDAMRKATRISKQAIFLVHKEEFKKAGNQLNEVEKLLKKLNKIPAVYGKFVYSGIVHSAFQEYVEARIFLKLTQDGDFLGPKQINVPSVSYLLGLADVVGELRRRALDSIRRGDIGIAVGSLENMELIYDEFILMYESMRVVSELRRKLDIARRIIEATRGDVAIEIRRDSLERSIEKLERALRVKKE